MKKVFIIVFLFTSLLILAVFASSYEPQDARMFFVGDMSFDRHIRGVLENKGGDYLFSCIGDFLDQADLVVGNLEGPITDKFSVSKGSVVGSPENFVFTFPTTTAKILYKNNVRLVNLGNNHIGDFGKEGFLSTKKYLEDAEVKYFGGAFGDESVYRKKIAGIDFVFISYNQFGGMSPERVAKIIKEEKLENNKVVVYTHWGEEYIPAIQSIKNTANLFAKSGADFVIGSHPHVVQEREKLGSSIIYYSLGNFIFDQYWNSDVSTGLILELNIKNKNISIVEHLVSIKKDGTTCLK